MWHNLIKIKWIFCGCYPCPSQSNQSLLENIGKTLDKCSKYYDKFDFLPILIFFMVSLKHSHLLNNQNLLSMTKVVCWCSLPKAVVSLKKDKQKKSTINWPAKFSKSTRGRLDIMIWPKNAPSSTMVGKQRKFMILEPLKWLFQCLKSPL